VALGGALARTDLAVVLAAEGAECELNGLFVGKGTQHLDNHTLIDHAEPHGVSRELYKGIMDDSSRGVFHGTIIVRPGAQKTDAIQTNKNLLLSRHALVDSTPALEIFADDVKCRHGATTGQLDPAALFYLRSRGIGEEDARALLTYAFASDLAGRIRVPELRAAVEAELGLRLAGGSSREEARP
jgi:Fe-S cluster assembly protein SufD